MAKVKVLFLAANPSRDLRLDEEIRAITAAIRASEHREVLEVVQCWALRPGDLQQALLEHQPHILHFSCHGRPSEEIILVDDQSWPKPVATRALVELFRNFKDNLQLVLLNACYSRPQAQAITQIVDCAIGMNADIGDKAAIKFVEAFYGALGFGRSVQTAFNSGLSALMLDDIPEDGIPELITRDGVDASGVVPVQPAAGIEPEPGTSTTIGVLPPESEAKWQDDRLQARIRLLDRDVFEASYVPSVREKLADAYSWPNDRLAAALFVFQELMANAFEHGCRGAGELEVRFSVVVEDAGEVVKITVHSPGEGFNFRRKLRSKLVDAPSETRGRGLLWVNKNADRLSGTSDGLEIKAWIFRKSQDSGQCDYELFEPCSPFWETETTELSADLRRALDRDVVKGCVIDVRRLKEISSHLLGVLASADRYAQLRSKVVVLINLSPEQLEVFKMIQIDKTLLIRASIEDAEETIRLSAKVTDD